MKIHYKPFVLAAALLASAPLASAQEVASHFFADWTGVTPGAATGSAAWGPLGTISYSIDFSNYPRANGVWDGTTTPYAYAGIAGNLDPYGLNATPELEWLGLYAGSIEPGNPSNAQVGYDLTFTFSDGQGGKVFPNTEPVFYVADVDQGNIRVTAKLNGVEVNASGWYLWTIQAEGPPGANGVGGTWNPLTQTMVGSGAQSSFYIYEFAPTSEFDEITFSYLSGSRGDQVFYAFGDTSLPAVPEPSGALLLGLAGTLTMLRRRRTA